MNGVAIYMQAQRIISRLRTILVRSTFAEFGKHSTIAGPIRIEFGEGISIGDGVFVGAGCWLQGGERSVSSSRPALVIGNRVSISGRATLTAAKSITIEDSVLIAQGVYMCDHTHAIDRDVPVRDQGITGLAPIVIKEGAWIGQNAVIMPGVTIGRSSVVGANSVVTKDVPARSVVAGVPARVMRRL